MRKKDTSCERGNMEKGIVDPERVDVPYENGKATPAEQRRRRLVVIRHATGIQLVATTPMLALAWEAIRQWQLPMVLLMLPIIVAGLAGTSYGWAAYGRIARKAIEGDSRGSSPGQDLGNLRRPLDSVIHMGIIAIPMIVARATAPSSPQVSVLTACSFVMVAANRMMWGMIGDEARASGSAAGRD